MVTMVISRLVIGTLAGLLIGFSLLIAWPLFAIVFGIIVVMKAVAYREPVTPSLVRQVSPLDEALPHAGSSA